MTSKDLKDYYNYIMDSLDDKYHNHYTNFPSYPISDEDETIIEQYSAIANHMSNSEYQIKTHLERLIG